MSCNKIILTSRIRPAGLIYPNDINQDYLKFLDKRSNKYGLTNVKTILGSVTETDLPSNVLDMVIIVNVVHCLAEPVELLKNIRGSLKPDGVIVTAEGNLNKDPSTEREWYSRAKLIKIYEDAGYNLFREENFLPKANIYFLK